MDFEFLVIFNVSNSLFLLINYRTAESSTNSRDKVKSRGKSNDKSSEPGSWLGEGRKAFTQRAGEFLRNMGNDIDAIGKDYATIFEGFISQLPVQQHIDLKFLMFRLNFTEFYSQLHPITRGNLF